MSDADAATSPATRRDVLRADEVLALAEELREKAASFLDDLDRAIQEFRARTEDGADA